VTECGVCVEHLCVSRYQCVYCVDLSVVYVLVVTCVFI